MMVTASRHYYTTVYDLVRYKTRARAYTYIKKYLYTNTHNQPSINLKFIKKKYIYYTPSDEEKNNNNTRVCKSGRYLFIRIRVYK